MARSTAKPLASATGNVPSKNSRAGSKTPDSLKRRPAIHSLVRGRSALRRRGVRKLPDRLGNCARFWDVWERKHADRSRKKLIGIPTRSERSVRHRRRRVIASYLPFAIGVGIRLIG